MLPEYKKIAQVFRNSGQSASANLGVVEESAAAGEVAALDDHFRTNFGRPDVPGILKCFATHPPLLETGPWTRKLIQTVPPPTPP